MRYSEQVLEHFERPRNVAEAATGRAAIGRAGSEEAGAIVEFRLAQEDGCVTRLAFRAWGCPHTIAVASWLTGQLTGRGIDELLPLDVDEIASALGVPPEKWHCVLVAEDALRAALGKE